MKDAGKFYGHSVYFNIIWCFLWPFGLICGHFGIFFHFLVCRTTKNWQPWSKPKLGSVVGEKEEKNISVILNFFCSLTFERRVSLPAKQVRTFGTS
jgi:hypothetical protein